MIRAQFLHPIAIAMAMALALTGCSGAAAADSEPSPTPSSTLVTEVLPLGFPEAGALLLDGPILHVSHPGNIWAVWVYSTDLAGDLAAATAQLLAAGYENTDAGDGWADFRGPDYQVRVVALTDDKFGSSLAYTIAGKG